MGQLGSTGFISYRGKYHTAARALADSLGARKKLDKTKLIPPDQLCNAKEILLPYEFHELMGFIADTMSGCDAFVAYSSADYLSSYWTQMELAHWPRFSKDPVVYVAEPDDEGKPQLTGSIALEPLSKNEASLRARVEYGTNRRTVRNSRGMAGAWGKFAKNCFLVPCVGCDEHFLVTQKAVYAALAGSVKVPCPHCTNIALFEEESRYGNYYRKPVLIVGDTSEARMLEDGELNDLLLASEVPEQFGLVAMEGETLDSDLKKVMKMYGWVGLGLGVVGGVAYLLDKLNEKKES